MENMVENILEKTYKNTTVLITGHTGFKGAWLSFWLSQMGANVIGYALNPHTKPNLFKILKLKKSITSIHGNVLDEENLIKTILKYKPTIVFHLAAQALVRKSYSKPIKTIETNVTGTAKLLETCRKFKFIKSIIIVTSDKCYDNKEIDYFYNESDALGGYDPYSSSKGCAELVTNAYRNSFFNPADYGKTHQTVIASVRAGNVIGGGDWSEDRLIPDCVRSLEKKQTIEIRNPTAIRPWQHVFEPLSGYLWLGALMLKENIKYSGSWNFGPFKDSNATVRDVVELVIKRWGDGNIIYSNKSNLHESQTLMLDINKAINILKWQPVLDLKEGIAFTIEWYKNFHNKEEDYLQYSKIQIDTYIKKAKKKEIIWAL